MIHPAPRNRKRHGAAMVETAAVVSVFLLVLFGVLEYCRLLFIRQLVANAARDGARYATVNTMSPTVVEDTRARVIQLMGGMDGKVRNFTVQVTSFFCPKSAGTFTANTPQCRRG